MKPIELKDEHKSKLLEMCNNLFPVYMNWWLTSQNGNSDSKICNFVHNTDEKGNQTTIHWFEFCMTKLSFKLLSSNQLYNCFSCSVNSNGNPFIHPIDYLYEEFKKLK